MTDDRYMLRAVELAGRGVGAVDPNPLVGAVIVRDGEILAEGWHERYGELHAERNAIRHFYERHPGGDLKGASLYVTLEPCCHYGKTPPCTEAIIENRFRKVFVGSDDPNPLVAGKGIRMLREAGIEVATQVMKKECDALNYVFFHYIQAKVPYVVMKYAMTLDGKIATCTGKSKWITGEAAREQVHRDRDRYMAIMTGIGTVLADDPMLNCRLPEGGRDPIRIVCDSRLRTPLESRLVSTAGDIRTILATTCRDAARQQAFRDRSCEILEVPAGPDGKGIDLAVLMRMLGGQGISSILLEGGSQLNFSALKSGIVNRVQAYIAPKLFGGDSARTPVGGAGFAEVADGMHLEDIQIRKFGEDILLEGTCSS